MTVDPAVLNGKKFTAVLVYEDGSAQGDLRLLPGVAHWRDEKLFLCPEVDIEEFLIPAHVYDEIKVVTPDFRDILGNAEYFVLIPVPPIADDDDERIQLRFIPFD